MKKQISFKLLATILFVAVVVYGCRKDRTATKEDQRIQEMESTYNIKFGGATMGSKVGRYKNLDSLEAHLKSLEKTVTNASGTLVTIEGKHFVPSQGLIQVGGINKYDKHSLMATNSSEEPEEPEEPTDPGTGPGTGPTNPGGGTSATCHKPNQAFNTSSTIYNFSNGTNMLWVLNYSTNSSGVMINPTLQGFMSGYTPSSSTISTPYISYQGSGKYYITVVTTQTESLTGSGGPVNNTATTQWALTFNTCENTINYSYTTSINR